MAGESNVGIKDLAKLKRLFKFVLLLLIVLILAVTWDMIDPSYRVFLDAERRFWVYADMCQIIVGMLIASVIGFMLYAIKNRKYYSACLKLSWALFVLLFPIGPALGSYSLYVLKRPEVGMLFKVHLPDSTDIDRKLYIMSILNHTQGVLALLNLVTLAFGMVIVRMAYNDIALEVLFVSYALFALFFSFGSFFVGWAVARRTHYTACRVMSALNCIVFPIGTAIGIYSLIMMKKHRVIFEMQKHPHRS